MSSRYSKELNVQNVCYFMEFSSCSEKRYSLRTKALKKRCLRFAIFHCSKKLQYIFETGFKKCEVIVQKSLSEKYHFEINSLQTIFCCLYVNLAIVQI